MKTVFKEYMMVYDGTTYYFVKNLFGDVVAICNGSGTIKTLAKHGIVHSMKQCGCVKIVLTH